MFVSFLRTTHAEISIAAENLPLPRRNGDFENLWIFKSVTDLN